MSTYQPHSRKIIKSLDEAINLMVDSTFVRSRSLIGVEWEHLIVDPQNFFRMAGYENKRGICEILKRMGKKLKFTPLYENGNVLGLTDSSGQIRTSLEPGGQIEWATKPVKDLYSLEKDLSLGKLILEDAADEIDVTVMNLGLHPTEKPSLVPAVPKERYLLMSSMLKKRGSLVKWMMQRTASIQINLDICSKKGFTKMWRIVLSALPSYTAIMANSGEMAGKRNGYTSNRLRIWSKTASDRCGVPDVFFRENFTAEDYFKWAFGVTQLFVVRGERWFPIGGKSLKDAFKNGWNNIGPVVLDDIELHISTLFPEIRLKPFLEIRSGDSGNLEMCLAASAFWKALIHGSDSIVVDLDKKTFRNKFVSAYKNGLSELYSEARIWLERARAGLIRLGEDTHYLEPFDRIIYQAEKCGSKECL